jgi:hypothetical protein
MTEETILAALPPVPETVVIGGETLEISPLKVGDLPGFLRAVRPFIQHLNGEVDWLMLFGTRGEDLVCALAIACRRPKEWVAALALDEAIRLAESVFEVNADFFIRRLAPEITRVSQRIGARIPGLMSSSGSSCTATIIPTS